MDVTNIQEPYKVVRDAASYDLSTSIQHQELVWLGAHVPDTLVFAFLDIDHQGKVMRYLLGKGIPLVVLAGSLFGPDPILVGTDIRLCFGVYPSCVSDAAAGKMDDEVSVL